jgi:hypothetical protein
MAGKVEMDATKWAQMAGALLASRYSSVSGWTSWEVAWPKQEFRWMP